MHSIQFPVSK